MQCETITCYFWIGIKKSWAHLFTIWLWFFAIMKHYVVLNTRIVTRIVAVVLQQTTDTGAYIQSCFSTCWVSVWVCVCVCVCLAPPFTCCKQTPVNTIRAHSQLVTSLIQLTPLNSRELNDVSFIIVFPFTWKQFSRLLISAECKRAIFYKIKSSAFLILPFIRCLKRYFK